MNASGQTGLSTSEASCVHVVKVGAHLGASQKSWGEKSQHGGWSRTDELFPCLVNCWVADTVFCKL